MAELFADGYIWRMSQEAALSHWLVMRDAAIILAYIIMMQE